MEEQKKEISGDEEKILRKEISFRDLDETLVDIDIEKKNEIIIKQGEYTLSE